MKGFSLQPQKAPAPTLPQVSVDVIPGIPGVQATIAKAQASDGEEKKEGLDFGSTDAMEILKMAGPLLNAAIPGISAAMEAMLGGAAGMSATGKKE